MLEKLEIRNKEGELLEAIAEGQKIEDADEVLVMVHGFGTNLQERGLFDDISVEVTNKFPKMSVVRFSWPGFGKSEGIQEETTLFKVAESVEKVVNYVFKNKKPETKVNVLSHSMGNVSLAKAFVDGNFKFNLFISNNPSAYKTREESYEKWSTYPGAVIDNDGVVVVPRADGTITKIGPEFWETVDPEAYEANLEKLAINTKSILIRATEDPIVNNKRLAELPFNQIIEIHGNHSFSKPVDRKVFLEKLIQILGK